MRKNEELFFFSDEPWNAKKNPFPLFLNSPVSPSPLSHATPRVQPVDHAATQAETIPLAHGDYVRAGRGETLLLLAGLLALPHAGKVRSLVLCRESATHVRMRECTLALQQ